MRLSWAKDTAELSKANAQLVIGTLPSAMKDEAVGRMLDVMIAKAVAVLGLLMLLAPLLISRGRRLLGRVSLHGGPPPRV